MLCAVAATFGTTALRRSFAFDDALTAPCDVCAAGVFAAWLELFGVPAVGFAGVCAGALAAEEAAGFFFEGAVVLCAERLREHASSGRKTNTRRLQRRRNDNRSVDITMGLTISL